MLAPTQRCQSSGRTVKTLRFEIKGKVDPDVLRAKKQKLSEALQHLSNSAGAGEAD